MYVRTINYTDFDGNKRTEDYHFNLSKSELSKWQLSHDGGLSKLLERIIKENDTKNIYGFFEEFIIRAFGVKSDDGKRFSKRVGDDEYGRGHEFIETAAYEELMFEILSDAEKAANFVKAIVPADLL